MPARHTFTEDMENDITNKWGYTAYFNSFLSQSRGVAILFNNKFDFIVHRKNLMIQVIFWLWILQLKIVA